MRHPKSKHIAFSLFLSIVLVLYVVSVSPVNSEVRSAIYIRDDGSVEGTSSIQRSGNVYTFTSNVTGDLYVEKDNIVIDGAGYTLQASENRGIVLEQRSGVTVKNTQITLEGGYTIDLRNASNCHILGNTLIGLPMTMLSQLQSYQSTSRSSAIAINCMFTENCTIADNVIKKNYIGIDINRAYNNSFINNTIIDGSTGIDFQDSHTNLLKNNHMGNNSRGFSLRMYESYRYENNIDASNTVDGKSIYYWVREHNRIVPLDAAYVVLVNCSGITVCNISPEGVFLCSTTDSTINDIRLIKSGNPGVGLSRCSRIIVANCTFKDLAIGIRLELSHRNTITQCTITNCLTRGIAISGSNNNLFSKNVFTNNSHAVGPSQDASSSGNLFTENLFTENDLALSSNGGSEIILSNTFTANDNAILWSSGQCNVTGNIFRNNNQAAYIYGSNNVFKNNRMENNALSFVVGGLYTNVYSSYGVVNIVRNDIDASNTIDGRPMIYWVDQHDKVVPADAATVFLVSCTNITAENLYLTGNGQGIVLIDTTASTVKGNTIIANSFGIGLFAANQNSVVENYIAHNSVGLRIANSTNNMVANNSFLENKGDYNGFAIIFTGNQKDNTIIRNDFIDSHVAPMLQISINKYDGPGWGNIWNDFTSGNYWSDYQTRYTNVTEVGNSGVGNTPFVINENNIDHHPLLQPINQVTPAPFPSMLPSTSPTSSPVETPSPEPVESPYATVESSSVVSAQPTAGSEQIMPPATLVAVIVAVSCIVVVVAGAVMLRLRQEKIS